MKMLSKTLVLWTLALQAMAEPTSIKEVARSRNPEPGRLSTLVVSEREEWERRFIYLSAEFPNVPGLTCDLWCYESDGIEFKSAKATDAGGIEMRHSWEGRNWEVVSTATPEAGALEFTARLEPMSGARSSDPENYPGLNVCWQLRNAPSFASKPDPYPEFVKRCFIFTAKGRKFLHEIGRRPIPVQATTSEYNNPPWVQMYAHISAGEVHAGSNSWADYSPDPFLLPLIGAVSRDRMDLAAMATGSVSTLSQAWHDCMHNNPDWLPAKDGKGKEWRFRIYAMRNDESALLRRFRTDFPEYRLN